MAGLSSAEGLFGKLNKKQLPRGIVMLQKLRIHASPKFSQPQAFNFIKHLFKRQKNKPDIRLKLIGINKLVDCEINSSFSSEWSQMDTIGMVHLGIPRNR